MTAAQDIDRPADDMNANCLCLPLRRADIDAEIEKTTHEIADELSDKPTLFANTAVFVTTADLQNMYAQIGALEQVIASPPFQDVIGNRDHFSPIKPTTPGLFMGYDFHITPDGPRLIEINTNAGGAYLAVLMQNSIRPDDLRCGPNDHLALPTDFKALTQTFLTEWAAQRKSRLRTVAIVDENPKSQYLYPEMLLIKTALKDAGVSAFITDPSALEYDKNGLSLNGRSLDMVYNRLTDFDLSNPAHGTIKAAYAADKIVLSPSPVHHALYADKRNLILFSDPKTLRDLGASDAQIKTLQAVPMTQTVTTDNADELWANRRQLFFKPKDGFGSRGSYRGAKLTKTVWAKIVQGGYVAQAFIAPTMRATALDGQQIQLKFDMRVYTYAGQPLAVAARVYQGQTTNFRTKGGGFSPVLSTER